MRTVYEPMTTRAAARSRVARARRPDGLRALARRLGLDRPVGVAGVCAVVTLVLGSALFLEHFVPFTLQLHGFMGMSVPQRETFADTGEILFTPVYGNSCRKILFSNRTGRFGPDQNVRCDTGLPPGREVVAMRDAGPSERMTSIRQAFSLRGAH